MTHTYSGVGPSDIERCPTTTPTRFERTHGHIATISTPFATNHVRPVRFVHDLSMYMKVGTPERYRRAAEAGKVQCVIRKRADEKKTNAEKKRKKNGRASRSRREAQTGSIPRKSRITAYVQGRKKKKWDKNTKLYPEYRKQQQKGTRYVLRRSFSPIQRRNSHPNATR